nr:4-(cytidine 5'-diphospho)-2-C-methyl-D-erythritol kinase [Desulfobacterales bacterium]
MNVLTIESPAKINLFLKVVGKRGDGYHELITLLCRITLFDRVILSFDTPFFSVRCSHPAVPQNEANIAYKAARLFQEVYPRLSGVEITIEKEIPVAAGLGGGSSNAASVLMGLNSHFGSPLTGSELLGIARKIGADVPFFIFKKPVIATGIGDQFQYLPYLFPYRVVVVCPDFEVPTALVYKKLKLGLTKCEKNFNLESLKKSKLSLDKLLHNDLEKVTIECYPEIAIIKEKLVDLGANGTLMSGSGPSVFGLFRSDESAKRAYRSLIDDGRWRSFLTQLILK